MVPIRKGCGGNNEDLLDLFARWPGRFIGLAGIAPLMGMDEAMAEYRSYHSLEECLDSILHQLLEKKKPMWNIYRSVNRDVFETGLMKLCDYVTRSYMTQLAAAYPICADDQELLTGFYRDECFGLIMGWMMRGMQEDVLPSLHRLCALRRGMAEEILRRVCEERGVAFPEGK